MSKIIQTQNQIRESILAGVKKLNDLVKITIGPKGRYVLCEQEFESPLVTNDGVSIIKEVDLEDPFENMGAKLVYEVASKTNDIAGDGTTTATILASSMIHLGIREVQRGANPVLIKEGMNIACKEVEKYILNHSRKIQTREEIKNIATISSLDESIGHIIDEAIACVKEDGVISVGDSNDFTTRLELVEGMQYEQGFISPYMASMNKIELDNPYILITNLKIQSIQEIIHILESILPTGRSLLIIAESFEQEVVSTLVLNKLRGTMNIVATKAPQFGDYQKEFLKDLCVLTNTTFVSKELGMNLKDIHLEHLGSASKVTVTKDHTTIIHGNGDHNKIDERIEEIKGQIDTTLSKFERKNLKERLAKLSNGIAMILVGGATESEIKEKKLRIEDALNATKAALSEGIVSGGGCCFVEGYRTLIHELKHEETDVQKGIYIVLESLLEPMKQIANNGGYNGEKIIQKQLIQEENIGFNAMNGMWVNLYDEGIIDPTKVERTALLNSVSIASLLILSEAGICAKNHTK